MCSSDLVGMCIDEGAVQTPSVGELGVETECQPGVVKLAGDVFAQVAIERRQRLAAGRCEAIADQFEQVLAEVANNRLEQTSGPIHRRLRTRVIVPLRTLAQDDIPAAADVLDATGKLAEEPQSRDAALADAINRQRTIIAVMEDILAGMEKLEGYQEAINLLREIVKEQKQVQAETIQALEKRISNIFDE